MGFWQGAITIIMVVGATALAIFLGVHFGGKWIDKMLLVPPPIDRSKPIVLKMPDTE